MRPMLAGYPPMQEGGAVCVPQQQPATYGAPSMHEVYPSVLQDGAVGASRQQQQATSTTGGQAAGHLRLRRCANIAKKATEAPRLFWLRHGLHYLQG